MNLTNPSAQQHIPDHTPEPEAVSRITHLGIGAHQDDLEFMAFHGIIACYNSSDHWFGGVTCTNGSGSARTGAFEAYTDEEMQAVRKQEQHAAADIGRYGVMFQLDFPSAIIKDPTDASLESDLLNILRATRPNVVYTHNPADKHDTHIAVLAATLRALRQLSPEEQPEQVLGCEVWRGLDWMMDQDKIAQNVSGHDTLAQTLNGLFASQIAGGKRYDLATIGRRRANATFFDAHSIDDADQVMYAMDLTPLIKDPRIDIAAYVDQYIQRFASDVQEKLHTYFPPY